MSATVVTVEELHALRHRHAELGSVNGTLQQIGHPVPVPVAAELAVLGSATADVVIRCLLYGAFGTFPAAVNTTRRRWRRSAASATSAAGKG